MNNQRNLLLAVLLCGLLLLGWDAATRYFYPQAAIPPATSRVDVPAERAAQASRGQAGAGQAALGVDAGAPVQPVSVAQALASSGGGRVPVTGPRLSGSINPVGAQLDDVTLTDHRESVNRNSDPVRWFAPAGTPVQQFARFGFLRGGQPATGPNTVWQVEGGPLRPGSPVTLRHRGADGLQYAIRVAVDDAYMFTVTQTVANGGTAPVATQPFATVTRTSTTATPDIWNIHSGPIGTFGGTVDYGVDYDDLAEAGRLEPEGLANWLGFTDTYWLSALIPQTGVGRDAAYQALGNQLFRADVIYAPVNLAPGQQVSRTTRLFAGAKESAVLDRYEDGGVARFGLAIDWGWFRWFEKPMLWLLRQFDALTGNWGVAIILLTLLIRLVLFPVAQKQFASMAAMKAIQPKMKAIQDRYKDDRQRQQQEIMKLYKDEKVNPVAGCLPMLIQIPILFALYKVLILAIEIRHQPFFGWIRDLSAPDPAHILNLFGLLPFDVPALLAIGPLAILLGITMWLTFRLNPTATDPVQAQLFKLMPWVLMFVMAPFAAGLLLYWITGNLLTVAQQSYLYSKHPQLRSPKSAGA